MGYGPAGSQAGQLAPRRPGTGRPKRISRNRVRRATEAAGSATGPKPSHSPASPWPHHNTMGGVSVVNDPGQSYSFTHQTPPMGDQSDAVLRSI